MIDYSKLPTRPRRISRCASRARPSGRCGRDIPGSLKTPSCGRATWATPATWRSSTIGRRTTFLAVGLYDPLSPIRIKVLQALQPIRIDRAFFAEKLKAAQAKREALINEGTTGYRLVYGESDGFPALIIDRYGDTLVLKLYTSAWLPHLEALIGALEDAALSLTIWSCV